MINKGYTLIELLIAMAIALIITLSITRFFIMEHNLYTIQEAKAEMYQTLRGAMRMFTGELILAGYGLPPGIKRITIFNRDEIEFRTNLRDVTSSLSTDTSPGQNILYVKDGTGRTFEQGDIITVCNSGNDKKCEKHILLKDGRLNSLTLTTGLGTAFSADSRIDLINTISYRHNRSRGELQRKIDRGNWAAVAENMAEDGFLISYRDKNNNTPTDSSDINRIDIVLTVESFRRDANLQENNGYRRASAENTIMLRN